MNLCEYTKLKVRYIDTGKKIIDPTNYVKLQSYIFKNEIIQLILFESKWKMQN